MTALPFSSFFPFNDLFISFFQVWVFRVGENSPLRVRFGLGMFHVFGGLFFLWVREGREGTGKGRREDYGDLFP